jgi:pimeloyl-ACP methyl ester carboxylesterase
VNFGPKASQAAARHGVTPTPARKSEEPMTAELPLADRGFPRRTFLMGSSLGMGAGLVSGLGSRAQAQIAPAAPGNDKPIWSAEYWANKGSIRLNLWRKRVGAPNPGEPPLPVLFLVHGSSNSTRTSYDLAVPGKGEYSFMNIFARYGYDVWTMDHDGYGLSGSSGNNSDIASGVEDLKAAIPVVVKETGQQRLHFYGTSSGAIRAGAYAQTQPEHVAKLVLAAFTYKGSGSPEIARRNARAAELRANPRRRRDAAMIRSIFTRDGHASAYDPAVTEAIIAQEMKFGDTIPSGTYLDMAVNLPLVDPKKVRSPVLMIRGEHDGNSTNDDLLEFFRELPNGDRQFVILPHTAHSIGYSNNRHLLHYAVRNFLASPAAVQS